MELKPSAASREQGKSVLDLCVAFSLFLACHLPLSAFRIPCSLLSSLVLWLLLYLVFIILKELLTDLEGKNLDSLKEQVFSHRALKGIVSIIIELVVKRICLFLKGNREVQRSSLPLLNDAQSPMEISPMEFLPWISLSWKFSQS